MSKLVAFAAIQGAYNIVSKAEGTHKRALEQYGPDQKVEFPNTAYYLPIIYSLLGIPVQTLGDAQRPMEIARKLLPPHIKGRHHLPYLGPLLDAGMAALFAEEVAEAIRYVDDPDFYYPSEECDVENGRLWLGAADDIIMRKRGVEFVDGTAPGFAAIVGAAPDPETAKEIAEEYQRRNLYVFMAATTGVSCFTTRTASSPLSTPWAR
jgi:acetyl-CoA synthase